MHIFRVILSTYLILLCGLTPYAQELKTYESIFDKYIFKILDLDERNGRLWFIYQPEYEIGTNQGNRLEVGFYDGYNVQTFSSELAFKDFNLRQFSLFHTTYEQDYISIQVQNPSLLIEFDKKSLKYNTYAPKQDLHGSHLLDRFDRENVYAFYQQNDSIIADNVKASKTSKRSFSLGESSNLSWYRHFVLDDGSLHIGFYKENSSALICRLRNDGRKSCVSVDNKSDYYWFRDVRRNEELVFEGVDENLDLVYALSTDTISYRKKKVVNTTNNAKKIALKALIRKHKLQEIPASESEKNYWYYFNDRLNRYTKKINKGITSLDRRASYRAIQPYNDQYAMIGAQNNEIVLIDRENSDPSKTITIGSKSFFGSPINTDGSFYLYAEYELFRYHPFEKINKQVTRLPEKINAACFSDSYLYLANGWASEIYRYNVKEEILESLFKGNIDKKSNYLLKDQENVFLFGENGIDIYNEETKKLTNFKHPEVGQFFTAKIIGDKLFAGSDNDRIYVYKYQNEKLELTSEINVGSNVYSLEKDDEERIWIGTSKGLMYFEEDNPNTLLSIEGSLSLKEEANRYSLYFDEKYRKLYYGTIRSLTILDLDEISFEASNRFDVQFSKVQYSDDSGNEKVDLMLDEEASEIRISKENRFLSVSLLTDFDLTNQVQYTYSTDNKKSWNSAPSNQILFSSLPAGKSNIYLRGKTLDGSFSENTLKLTVNVDSFIYENWWFWMILAMGALSIFTFWVIRIRNQNQRLEKMVALRTKKVNDDKITIQKQAEELVQMDEMKSRFFSNISHELKTPLSLIKLPIEKLTDESIHADQRKFYLGLIRKNSNLLEERVQELLELSRLEAGKSQLIKSNFYLREVIQESASLFIPQAESKKILYNIDIAVGDSHVYMDQIRLQKIIQNLINNAIKFSSESDMVSISCKVVDNSLTIIVRDTGVGISDSYQEKIFERFYQVSTKETLANPGTGIGLSIVADFVEMMEGSIHLKSKLDYGSTFTVTLPLPLSKETMTQKEIDHNIKQVQEPILSKPTLLIVEDNQDLRNLLETILSPSFETIVTSNGVEAWDALSANNRIDIILSDVMMPLMDGAELLKKVKADDRFKNLPFLFLTAKSDIHFKTEMIRIGVDDYITKPFQEDTLIDRLSNLYGNLQHRIISLSEDNDQDTIDLEFVDTLQQLIIDNLNHPQFSVEFLAEHQNISRRTLLRKVNKNIGMTIKAYIKEIQLNVARNKFEENPNVSMKEISNSLGFSDVNYFKKIYNQRFGTDRK